MPRLATAKLSDLYEADETAWLEETARRIKGKRYRGLDYKHLAEYLSDMAKRDRREVDSRLVGLMSHLLKIEYQPWMKSESWETSVLIQRHELEELFKSKILQAHGQRNLQKAYERAVRYAAAETGLEKDRFPPECPYTFEGLMEPKKEN